MGMKSRRTSSSTTNPSTQRAWRLLRLALLWARKGGIMKCRLFMAELRLIPKHLKSLKPNHHHQHNTANNQLTAHYGERQLSFDKTPIIHMRMSRPASLRFMIPACMKPDHNLFDYDFKSDRAEEEISCLYCNDDSEEVCSSGCDDEGIIGEEMEDYSAEGIDEKAEEFINKFYREMKLQRQISYLQYTDMINRGATV